MHVIRHPAPIQSHRVTLFEATKEATSEWAHLATGRTATGVRCIVTIGLPLRGTDPAAAGAALTPEVCRELVATVGTD